MPTYRLTVPYKSAWYTVLLPTLTPWGYGQECSWEAENREYEEARFLVRFIEAMREQVR